MAPRTPPKISIVGTGRVGSSLAIALYRKGYTVASLVNRSGASALALARAVRCSKVSTNVGDVSSASDIVFIAVNDDAITATAKELSLNKKLNWKKLFVAHASGVQSSLLLRSCEQRGAVVASMHPLQTFPKSQKITPLHGIYFGIEGPPKGLAKAGKIVDDLGSRSVVVAKEVKPLYHAACVFSSGYLIVMLNAISEIAALLRFNAKWTEVFGPLMTAAMENAIRHSASAALTGPVVRGDLGTLKLHIEALASRAPQFLPVYIVAGVETARIARESGSMSEAEYRTIVSTFRKYIPSIPTTKHPKGKK